MTGRFAIALWLLGYTVSAHPQNMTLGTVRHIHDGDSLVIALSETREVEIRLAEIDAPEKQQPFSDDARNALQALLQDQQVSIELFDVDSYGRIVARVWRSDDGLYVNAWMIRNGYAWAYERYVEDPAFAELQRKAMTEKLGLWQLPEPEREPPWLWREAGRTRQ